MALAFHSRVAADSIPMPQKIAHTCAHGRH